MNGSFSSGKNCASVCFVFAGVRFILMRIDRRRLFLVFHNVSLAFDNWILSRRLTDGVVQILINFYGTTVAFNNGQCWRDICKRRRKFVLFSLLFPLDTKVYRTFEIFINTVMKSGPQKV